MITSRDLYTFCIIFDMTRKQKGEVNMANRSKPQTFTMDEESIKMLNNLSGSTGLKKSTVIQMLIKNTTPDKMAKIMTTKVKL